MIIGNIPRWFTRATCSASYTKISKNRSIIFTNNLAYTKLRDPLQYCGDSVLSVDVKS
jgi:hypothetical protein